MEFTQEDGSPATAAGSHPFAMTTSIGFEQAGELTPDGELEDLRISLPEGLSGTPGFLPACSRSRLLLNACPAGAAVGTIAILVRLDFPAKSIPAVVQAPVYNMIPPPGTAGELGVYATGGSLAIPLTVDLGVSPQRPNLTFASLTETPRTAPILGLRLILWGNPTDPAHDSYRGACGSAYVPESESFEELSSGSCPLEQDPRIPFLSLPTSCTPSFARFDARAWDSRTASPETVEVPPPSGCAELGFAPSLGAALSTRNASAPSGLDLWLDQPNEGLRSSDSTADAGVVGAALDLPAGMGINPPAASGLAFCTEGQLLAAASSAAEGVCPAGSQIGTAELSTPIAAHPLEGRVYLSGFEGPAAPGSGSRFALSLVIASPEQGISVVQPISVAADPGDGRLRVEIDEIPKLPLDHLELHLDSGPQAPLATPPRCGANPLAYSLRPSSGNPATSGVEPLELGDNCRTRFRPTLGASPPAPPAGAPTTLSLRLVGSSHEGNPAAISLTFPEGLAADFREVSTCPEPEATRGDCPAASRVGSAEVAVGAGPDPLRLPTRPDPGAGVYLAGPYLGAPFSLTIGFPTAVGLLDFGTVVLRAPIAIDPVTAQGSIRIPELPQVLSGIPLHYREVRLAIDRPGFLRAPTSCARARVIGTATSGEGESARLADPFEAVGCAGLAFKPTLSLRLAGGLGRNGHPALRALLRARPGDAGIARTAFTMPPGELLDLRHLRALCPRDSSSGRCPPGSELGRVRLATPILGEALEGPIYLREPRNGLPDLIADLRGSGIHLVLHGRITAPGGRLRIEFRALPDIPISRAAIVLPGGRRGLLVNSRDLCGRPHEARVSLESHSGKRRRLRSPLHLSGVCGRG